MAVQRTGGNIQFDPAHPDQCSFDVSVDAASVNTDNSMRDEHLRKDNYFDVKTWPRIRFQLTKSLLPIKQMLLSYLVNSPLKTRQRKYLFHSLQLPVRPVLFLKEVSA